MRQHTFSLRRGGQIFTVVLVVALTLVRAAAVHLLQGESVTMNLSGLIQERPNLPGSTCQEIGEVLVRFQGDLLLPGDSIRIELFENSTAEAPFSSMDRSGLGQGTGALGTYIYAQWQDLQGVIRLTMLAGSVNVDSVYVSIQNNGCGHSTNTFDSPTPPTISCPGTAVVDCGNGEPLVVNVADVGGEALTVRWLVNGVAKETNFVPGVSFGTTSAQVPFLSGLGLGQYQVTALVANSSSSAACSTMLTVADLAPPVLFCPSNQIVEFVSALGAAAEFTVGTMDCDTNVAVVSVPASGSVFPIGTNVVRTTATDGATNGAGCEFTITVLGARGVLSNLLTELTALRETETEEKQQRRLDDALERLNDTLKPGRFLDETHVARREGSKVFRQHQRAVRKLVLWMKRERDPELDDRMRNFIERLLRADRLLASVAIQDAVDAEGNATRIARAQVDLAKGDLAALRGREAQAIALHRSAWLHAGRAVR